MRLAQGKTPAMHSALYQARICVLAPAQKSADELMEVLSCAREKLPQLIYPESARTAIGFCLKAPE